MKVLGKLIILLLLVGGLASCDGMDATYKEFIKDGPIVYIGKVDSLKAYSGRNRVMLEWQKLLDPRAKKAKIFWEDGTKSVEIPLTNTLSKTQYIVDNLAEGTYVFEVYTFDDYDNTSVKVEVPGTVYGETYEHLLFNTKVKKAVLKGQQLTITFAESLDNTFQSSEIVYTNAEGKEQSAILKAPQTILEIKNFTGRQFKYRSVYLPDPTSIDLFYSEYDDYVIN